MSAAGGVTCSVRFSVDSSACGASEVSWWCVRAASRSVPRTGSPQSSEGPINDVVDSIACDTARERSGMRAGAGGRILDGDVGR